MRPCMRTSQVMWHAMPRSSHYPTHSPGGKKKPEMAKFRVTGHWAPLFPTKIGPTLLSPPTSMNGATCWPSQTPAGSLLFLPQLPIKSHVHFLTSLESAPFSLPEFRPDHLLPLAVSLLTWVAPGSSPPSPVSHLTCPLTANTDLTPFPRQ